MPNIYQVSLDATFAAIVSTIARGADTGNVLNGLIVEPSADIQSLAEQAILVWATARQSRHDTLRPTTDLQHLLNEYCTIADHL